ncbi:MAG: rRNA pseudouridine synthase [Holosporales bacterium]|jgi:23S rRNA pseudouridine2605 synthase|nr:rRNA pseudouridine synthase [Holosporales bacterium]
MAKSNNNCIRLNKAMSTLGMCSRRDADRMIASGIVSVNGKAVTELGSKVTYGDAIICSGVSYTLDNKCANRVWIYYKPVGLITSHRDPQNRATVFDDIATKVNERIISIGRLDINSEGLLLLTNSGEYARRAELPSTALKRRYRARIFGSLNNDIVSQLAIGATIHGIKYTPVKIEPVRGSSGKNSWVECILTEGKNREIRKLFSHFGISVNRLIRTQYGPYAIGNLKPGEIREVKCLHI